MHGAATSPQAEVFALAAAQVSRPERRVCPALHRAFASCSSLLEAALLCEALVAACCAVRLSWNIDHSKEDHRR